MRVIRKLLIPTLTFIGLVITGLIAYNTIATVKQVNEAENQRLEAMNALFNTRLKSLGNLAIALASEVANNPEIQAAFAAKDRERLTELTLTSYQSIDSQFDIPQHQFHLAPATSFLRLHNLEKYGDDLSSFRFTVLAANAEKKPISGPEIGRGGLGVRGVVPVSYEGKHIGTVEFGTNVDQALLENLKKGFGFEWQLLLSRVPAEIATFEGATEGESRGPTSDLLLQASTLASPIYGSPENYKKALSGTESIEHSNVDNVDYAILSAPLYDFSGNVIGVIDIISNNTAVIRQRNNQIFFSLGILLLTLLVVSVGFSFIANRILSPIGELSTTASTIAEGDFSQRAKVTSDDEIGALAQVFNRMTEQLQGLFGTLEERVKNATRDLTLAAEVGRSLSESKDINTLLNDAVDLIQARFDMYYTQVYLLDTSSHRLILRAGTGVIGQQLLDRRHSLSMDLSSLNGTAAVEKRAVIVEDTEASIIHRPNPLLPKTRSEMVVPLIVGDRVVGVLDMQSSEAGALSRENLPAFEALAGQLAVAIQNVELLAEAETARTETEARARYLTRSGWSAFLNAVERGERIGYSYDLKEITPFTEEIVPALDNTDLISTIRVSNEPIGALQFERTENWTSNDTELVDDVAQQLGQQVENLRILAQADYYRTEAEDALRRLTRESWETYTYQKEDSLNFLYKDAQVRTFDEDESFAEGHSYKIKVRDEAIGQIEIAKREQLSKEEAELTKSVTEQLSAHLEKLRLSQQIEQALVETESLYTASRSITTAQDAKEVAETLVEHINHQKLDRVLVALIDDKVKGILKADVIALWDRAGALKAGNSFTDEQIPLLKTLGAHDAFMVDDFTNSEKIDDISKATFAYLGVKSAAIIPISVGETIFGWLLLETTQKIRRFSIEDMSSFTTLTSQAGVVLESQRLLLQTQERAQREQALSEITAAVRASSNPRTILKTAVRELGNIFGRQASIHLAGTEENEEKDA